MHVHKWVCYKISPGTMASRNGSESTHLIWHSNTTPIPTQHLYINGFSYPLFIVLTQASNGNYHIRVDISWPECLLEGVIYLAIFEMFLN